MKSDTLLMLLIGVAIAGGVILVTRKVSGTFDAVGQAVDNVGGWSQVPNAVGQEAGRAVVTAADGVVTGTVVTLGTTLGLAEPTDVDRGRAALARGDYLEASVYLPAGDFLSGAWTRLTH